MRIERDWIVNAMLALLGGLLSRTSFGLHPVWWLAWLAPVPLLVAVLRSGRVAAMGWAFLGGLFVGSAGLHANRIAMPLPWALLVLVLIASLWTVVLCQARRVMTAIDAPWSVLAYPLFWCAADTLLAHLHPDGNWPSLAYSQAGFAPALQVTSLLGVAGLVFVLALLPAALALTIVRGWRPTRWALAGSVALALGCIGFGLARIPVAASTQGVLVGLVAIDDFIGPRVPPAQVERIWSRYERHVAAMAEQGARIVLLPEKIAVLNPGAAARQRARMAALAARTRVWLVVGVGIDDSRKTNHAWLFAPDGSFADDYMKHRLAPPERDFAAGSAFSLRAVDGVRYGLAICKDVHFAAFARDYAALGAQALLVPAWDFGEDGWYAARLSAVRGVETGMPMVRAAREGLLTITDGYGRVVAETPSAALPGATLLGRVPAALPGPTPYTRISDAFGWLCTAAAAALALVARRWRARDVHEARMPLHRT